MQPNVTTDALGVADVALGLVQPRQSQLDRIEEMMGQAQERSDSLPWTLVKGALLEVADGDLRIVAKVMDALENALLDDGFDPKPERVDEP